MSEKRGPVEFYYPEHMRGDDPEPTMAAVRMVERYGAGRRIGGDDPKPTMAEHMAERTRVPDTPLNRFERFCDWVIGLFR